MSELVNLWGKYNHYAHEISVALGRTSNIVGEYAEYLVNEHLNGVLLDASTASADIKTGNNLLYQVKARRITRLTSTQLSIIRSWGFDYLAVVLFGKKGQVLKSIISPVDIAKKYAIKNEHQNGWTITTTQEFLNDIKNHDITCEVRVLNGEEPISEEVIQATTAPSIYSDNKISKKDALIIASDFLNETVNNSNFSLSNQNSANGKWWLEPSQKMFNGDFYFALNDSLSFKVYLFHIPSGRLSPPGKYFKIRSDTNRVSVTINGDDIEYFRDCSNDSANIEFKNFLVGEVEVKV